MTIEEELKQRIIQKSGSVNKFAQDCGVSQSTIATMFSRGVDKTNINTIIKICKTLGISTDELANGRITPIGEIERPLIDIDRLNQDNKNRLLAYYQALIDSQEN